MPKFFQSEKEVRFFKEFLFDLVREEGETTVGEFFIRASDSWVFDSVRYQPYAWGPATLLSYFFPYLKHAEWPWTPRKLFDKLAGVRIELSKDVAQKGPAKPSSNERDKTIEEYKRMLDSLGYDQNDLREALEKIIESLTKSSCEPIALLELGVYRHSEKKIILYEGSMEVVAGNNEDLFLVILLATLAHELFHAYHAVKSNGKWEKVRKNKVLVESLATYNEYLFLLDLRGEIDSQSWVSMAADHYSRDLEDDAKKISVDIWPYSGFWGIRRRIDTAVLSTSNPSYEKHFLRSLVNGDPPFENSEIKMAYWHLV